MTEEEKKKLNDLLQYDLMGATPPKQAVGWGTFPTGQDANAQDSQPVIPNPNPAGA